MKNIIVFGATGNIGVYIVDYLHAHLDPKEYSIHAVGRKPTDVFEKMRVPYYRVDITSKEDFAKIGLEQVYAVVHVAGVLPAYVDASDPVPYARINIIGSLNILEYAREKGADRVLYTQTWSDLAGYWGKETVLRPDMPRSLHYTGDHAFYSITKSMVVDTLRYYREQFGIKDFVFRLPNIYLYNPQTTYLVDGKERPISYRYIIEKATRGEDIELWGDPKAFKDIIYVKDLCQMMAKALVCDRPFGLYNAGTGVATTFEEQIKGIIDVFAPENQPKPKIIYRPEKPSFTSFVMDIENAKEELGYEPAYNYRQYLEDYKKERAEKRFDSLWL